MFKTKNSNSKLGGGKEMKVYVVTSGEYSDYGLDGVFSSRELAQKHIDTLTFDGGRCEFNEILELELDPNKAELISGRVPFQVDMRKDGGIFNIERSDSYLYSQSIWNPCRSDEMILRVYCAAKDEKHAIKITNEKRAQLIALNKWEETKR